MTGDTTSDGTWTYAYDSEGNVVSKTRISDEHYWAYTFGNNNQMTEAVERTSALGTLVQDIVYGYDAFGNMVSRTVGTMTTGSAYDITDRGTGFTVSVHTLLAETDGTGALVNRYLTADGVDLARTTATMAYWLLADRQGSVRNVTDGAGAVVGTIAYTAFGGIRSETNSAVSGNLLFTGSQYDRQTGLYKNKHRDYDSQTGQWLSEDQTGFDGRDVNLRRYVHNDPTNRTDRNGLEELPAARDWRWVQNWHHNLPRSIFTDAKLRELGLKIDINDAKWGTRIQALYHTGVDGIHPRGWNPDWEAWLRAQKNAGAQVTEAMLEAQVRAMQTGAKYGHLFQQGQATTESFTEWT